jgi:hypothetical protein
VDLHVRRTRKPALVRFVIDIVASNFTAGAVYTKQLRDGSQSPFNEVDELQR